MIGLAKREQVNVALAETVVHEESCDGGVPLGIGVWSRS